MKFTKRQIKILGIASFATFLVLPASFVIVKNLSRTDNIKNIYENPKPITPPINPPPIDNNLSLVEARNLSISSIQTFQTQHRVSDRDLVNKLKSADNLFTSNDWRDYFKEETKISKFNNKLTFVSQLVSKVLKERNPTPPTPHYDNKWEQILSEIRNFINTNPSSLSEVNNWLAKKSYSSPLEGVNLNPSDENLRRNGNSLLFPILARRGGRWEKYLQLQAAGDGNCFINSFSVLLTGINRDISLALRLRVAMCLEVMSHPERYTWPGKELEYIKETLVGKREEMATNRAWLDNSHIEILSNILKRKIVLISVVPGINWALNVRENPPLENNYSEPFFIFNSGGHFQPLLRPKDHDEGQISFQSERIDIDYVNHSILFNFNHSTLKRSGFTLTNETRFNNMGFNSKSKIRVLYDIDVDAAKEEFKRMVEEKLKEKDSQGNVLGIRHQRKYNINIIKTQGIQVNSNDEICLNYDCYEEIYII